jgi:carboxypeptidase D
MMSLESSNWSPRSHTNITGRAPPLAPSAATFFTSTVPLLPSGQSVALASGYLPARPPRAGSTTPADDAHLYFVLEKARHLPSKRRLIIWFNGGPGCSSFDGLMMEIGAFRPDQKGGIEWTTPGGSWNEYADVLYCEWCEGIYSLPSSASATLC